ncbi:MAG: signal peptidase II [Dehalococcoidia bacterium]|nr:signal peptidase II [Dehalococcoidia bacterium]
MIGKSRLKEIAAFLLPAATAVSLDQLTKYLVKQHIALGGSVPATGFFRLTHVRNTGASFGIFQEHTVALAVVSAVMALVVLWLGIFMNRRFDFLRSRLSLIALGMMLGGIIGNFIDRTFIGYVTDFLKMGAWPDYNIADASAVVGSIVLAVILFRSALNEHTDGPPETTRC